MCEQSQKPVAARAPGDVAERLAIVTHPAVRLGFLDAQRGKPIDHDHILDRIERETPTSALKRLKWSRSLRASLFPDGLDQAALAQYRYEEGRLLVKMAGLRCRSWNHPDYPPAQVVDFCLKGSEAAE